MTTIHEPSRVAYRARNEHGTGTPVVFVHGAGGNKLTWLSLTRDLAKRWPDRPLYIIDLPGHGDAPGPGRGLVKDYAEDFRKFLEGVCGRSADLVGHSMGGAIVLTLALDAPRMVRRVATVGSGYRLAFNRQMIEAFEADFSLAMSFVREIGFASVSDPAEMEAMMAGLMSCDPEVALGDFRACAEYSVKDRIASLVPPLAVYFGSADLLTDERRNLALALAVPGAIHHRFEGAGHMLMVERTAELAARLAEFLDAP